MVNDSFDLLFSVALGIGLAAATGFRVFLPLLVAGLAARAGWDAAHRIFRLAPEHARAGRIEYCSRAGDPGLLHPGVDHLLDVLAAPLAVIAGVVASASVMVDMPAEVRWPIAVIAGGGVAALTKGAAAVVRAKSAALTGGLGNPVVSTAETAGAVTVSILALVAPLLCLVGVIAIAVWAVRRMRRSRTADT